MQSLEEEWRVVVYDDRYEVSSWGRVRSWAIRGHWHKAKEPKIIEWSHISGYKAVIINRKTYFIHHLVCEAFHGPRPEGQEACHYPDRDITNNRADNLKWGTREENQQHRAEHGTSNRGKTFVTGDQLPQSKLSYSKVRELRVEYRVDISDRELRKQMNLPTQKFLAEREGVAQSVMSRALRGEIWNSTLTGGGE